MSAKIDLTGQRFGRLTVAGEAGRSKNGHIKWLCLCDCGNSTIVSSCNLRGGAVASCGCLMRERVGDMRRKHGGKGSRLYRIWRGMRYRCLAKGCKRYSDYGGRGIRICPEWDDFAVFRDWALANGYRDDLTLDRIDVNGNYEPGNCRWATYSVQNKNRRK